MRAMVFLVATAVVACFADLPRLLVFNKVEAGQYVHESIPDGAGALIKLGRENGFVADSTSDLTVFNSANLARYKAVAFNNTGGEVLDIKGQQAFQAFIRAGGEFVGYHSACGTEYKWPWYGDMIGGAYFKEHPAIQKAKVKVEDANHISTAMLPAVWERTDEWHDYQADPRSKVHVLLTLDESSYTGGTMGKDHPIAWCREYEGDRAWFSSLAHGKESFQEPLFLAHLLGGVKYAMALAPVASLAQPGGDDFGTDRQCRDGFMQASQYHLGMGRSGRASRGLP